MDNYLVVLKKYAEFGGRATRQEYWMFQLYSIIISVVLSIVANMKLGPISTLFSLLYIIYALAVLIPTLAVSVRRLHDTDHSGWWLLISLIPLIGVIVLIIFLVRDSQGDNQYGPNPKGVPTTSNQILA